ncbi:MAG TPA: TonB family protein, partial [Longimicrobium sp.]|nr:TonB family protein [Longimicrobium sp.]
EMALDSALEIGVGGEARVLGIRWDAASVAKLYHRPTLEQARKLALMMETPPTLPSGASIAWPADLLTDPRGARFAGFLMPRAEGPRVFEFYNPVSRRKTAPLFDWARLHRAGANLAAAFDGLHAHGYVVGDVNESNILVSPTDASVVLVDADSFQVRGPGPRELYRSKVGKAEFTPPELQGTHFADVDRAPEHDRFGLAVILFLLLMEGTHPYACRMPDGSEAPPVEERILRGMFPHAPEAEGCRPPRMAPPFYTLDPALQALFLRAFVQGHADPAARPAAAEWAAALVAAEAALATCAANPRHRHAAHVEFCPWCHRTRVLQGRDPFPATVDLARVHDAPPLRRPEPGLPRPWHAPVPPRHVAPVPWGPPAPWGPPPPQAAVLAPQQPSRISLWAASTVQQTRSSLPAWAQPALGPDALANPVVWMPPAALTCLFGATGGVRMAGMLLFFLALRRLFRLNTVRVRPVTVAWLVMGVMAWLLMAGAYVGGARAADDGDPYGVDVDVMPTVGTASPVPGGTPVSPVVISEPVRLAGEPELDDWQPPQLYDEYLVDDAARRAYPPELRAEGIGGEAVVRVSMDDSGAIDQASVVVIRADHTRLGFAAAAIARQMKYNPALVDGNPVPSTVDITIRFNPEP